jgi:O-antigen/teichoic acid export membrane protein
VLHTLAANVLIQAINAGTGILTARVLLAQGRGELAAIILWPQFLAYMLTLGTPVSLVYQIKRHPDERGALIGAALVLGLIMGLIAMLIGTLGIPFWLHQYSPQDIRQAQFLMALAPVSLVGILLVVTAQANESFAVYNLVRYLPPMLTLVVLGVLAVAHRLDVAAAAWTYMLAGLPVFGWNLWWVRRHFRPSLHGWRDATRKLLSYGLRAWGSDLLGTISGQLDRLLVVGLLVPSDMGLYVVAQSLAGLLALLPNAIVPVLLPRAAGRPVLAALESVRQAAVLTLGAMLAAAVPLFFFGGLLLRVVYGAEFGAATAVFQLFLLQGVLAGVASVLTQALLATGRPGTVSLLQALALVTAAPLLVVLIPWLGLVGAGVALVCSTAMQLLAVVILYGRLRRTAVGTGALGPRGVAS